MRLTFSQKGGYAAYTGIQPDDLPGLGKTTLDWDDVLKAAGYVSQWSYNVPDHGDVATGYEMEGPNEFRLPPYLVDLWDFSYGHQIYCEDPGDFFALRMEMARNTQVTNPMLVELYALAEKAFRAMHGHDYSNSCEDCDPEGMKRLREARRQRAKAT